MVGVDFVRSQTEIWEMEDAKVSDSELVHHIKEALSPVSHGDNDRYNQLVGVMLHTKYLTLDETSLKALNGAISYIDATVHESLIVAIFEMRLWNYGAYVMDAIVELVISLEFCATHSFIDTLKQPRGLERKDQVLSRVHSALKDIADLVPLVPLRLEFIICQRMPSVFVKEPFRADLNRKSLQGNLIADKLDSLMALTFKAL